MSWWNPSQLSNFVKNAQKKIDKVLDIQEEADDDVITETNDEHQQEHTADYSDVTDTASETISSKDDSEFWNNWFDPGSSDKTKKNVKKQGKKVKSPDSTLPISRKESNPKEEEQPSNRPVNELEIGEVKETIYKQSSSDLSTEGNIELLEDDEDKNRKGESNSLQIEDCSALPSETEYANSNVLDQADAHSEVVVDSSMSTQEQPQDGSSMNVISEINKEHGDKHDKFDDQLILEADAITTQEQDHSLSLVTHVTNTTNENAADNEADRQMIDTPCKLREADESSASTDTITGSKDSNSSGFNESLEQTISSMKQEETPQIDENLISDNLEMVASSASIDSSSFLKFDKDENEEIVDNSIPDDDDRISEGSNKSSDFVKVDSHSGHTSGDDIDTTTSSDIEILSIPSVSTPNGDNGQRPEAGRPFDLTPLQKALREKRKTSPGHQRSDSHDSMSSFATIDSRTSPVVDVYTLEQRAIAEGKQLVITANKLEPQEKTCEDKGNSEKITQLEKKLKEVAEILDARENKLLDMSKECTDLRETNSILRSQLDQLEEVRENETVDVQEVTEEFTKRMSDMERKLQVASRERDSLKKQLAALASDKKTEKLLREKDEQISGLLEEGEKLSKQQLQSNTIIKKLKVKIKENESLLETQRLKLEEKENRVDHLQNALDSKEDLEKKQSEAINQLNSVVVQQEKELHHLRSSLEDADEKVRSMQVTLDVSFKELTELHKANATKESQEAALSAELQVKEELRIANEKQRVQFMKEKESLINQIDDLRMSLSRLEREHGRREDMLKQDIASFQQRLQDADGRNDELSDSISLATRPLLRQIENLQSSFNAQKSSWEIVERNLSDRLNDSHSQLVEIQERDMNNSEKIMEVTLKVTSLESQNAALRQEKARLTAQMEVERSRVELLEDQHIHESGQLESVKANLMKEMNEIKRDKVLLENQLEMEKLRVESEKKKVLQIQEAMKLQEDPKVKRMSPLQFVNNVRRHSEDHELDHTSLTNIQDTSGLERSLLMTSSLSGKSSLYDSMRQSGAANLLENLEAQLKLREGEIVQLQSEIIALEKTKESMGKELVNLTSKIDSLEEMNQELPVIKEQFQELNGRYNALLQMYGEKEEEVQELKLDILDVKDMYKTQIDELLKR